MYNVTPEVVESYRNELLNCALNKLRNNGHGTILAGEFKHTSKDLVQECYELFYKKSNLLAFVTEHHLRNSLYMFLDWAYQNMLDGKRKAGKFNSINRDRNKLKDEDEPSFELEDEFDDEIMRFKSSLTKFQHQLLEKIISGLNLTEIAKNENIEYNILQSAKRDIRNIFKKGEWRKEKQLNTTKGSLV